MKGHLSLHSDPLLPIPKTTSEATLLQSIRVGNLVQMTLYPNHIYMAVSPTAITLAAIESGNVAICEYVATLVSCDWNAIEAISRKTCLCYAIERGAKEVASFIIKQPTLLINGVGMDGLDETALHSASLKGYDNLIVELLQHGAHVDTQTSLGNSALSTLYFFKFHSAGCENGK